MLLRNQAGGLTRERCSSTTQTAAPSRYLASAEAPPDVRAALVSAQVQIHMRPRDNSSEPANLTHILGVDKAAISCQVYELPAPGGVWLPTGVTRRSATINRHGAGVQVTVGHVQRSVWARAEWNPSRLVDPEGWQLCSLQEWKATVEVVADIVARELQPVRPSGAWNLKRLDLARDFRAMHPDRLLVGLSTGPRAYAKSVALFRSPQTGEPQTLEIKVGRAGSVRLYDKHQENSRVPQRVLRWEVEARQWLKRKAEVRTVSEATASALSGLAWDRWRWSGMGASVVGPTAVALAIESLDATEAHKERLLGHVIRMTTPGVDVSASRLDAEIRRVLTEFGIALTPQWDPLGDDRAAVRLDLARGKEVVEESRGIEPSINHREEQP